MNGYNVEAMTPRAEAALKALNEAMYQADPERIIIEPGTALVFNNTLVLHGRDKIEAVADRWLQRVYGSAHVPLMQQVTGRSGPIFDTTPSCLRTCDRQPDLEVLSC